MKVTLHLSTHTALRSSESLHRDSVPESAISFRFGVAALFTDGRILSGALAAGFARTWGVRYSSASVAPP
ncbi:hypothetical protein OPV22_013439 [Ensete ventricosum]|uniref:Uncharacterized protein n=1 Tax=Ensete ventricosum TaxID=4639 RepID=A0AAV8R110_ENSVE|nr:hypothetical protein OPV22_013439 [Ensete ventricosum]